ncbi:MAG: hypothetical protein KBC48_01335 [Candidatus Pacebacteria bacterium]|nr:hypothetical protein [Candidatus Paceibacterota bacterium]
MFITTEFSGIGNYGVCTIIPRDILENSMDMLQKSSRGENWENFDLNHYRPLGIKNCFRIISEQDEFKVKLSWLSHHLADALRSHGLLMLCAAELMTKDRSGAGLEIHSAQISNGWCLQANLGDQIWDVMESPKISEILPQINSEIRTWWEDQEGVARHGQYAIIFSGKDGLTLQINQPTGNGVWVAGSRKSDNTNQITDHNTDTSFQCFAHVLSLCVVLKHCRKVVFE